ncbi:CBS domain-containing protein [Taklimakanibacter deserti]|uniref:CBS domain-containing protein n=1 Tax=Taklimakanibacter deserti TaxID=2267839 RepID=UPI000E6557DB
MQVQQIMQRQVSFAEPNMTIRDAARKMRADNLGALLVTDNGRLVGMVTDRDIVVRAVAEDGGNGATNVRDVMSEGVCYCFESDELDQAARVMARHQVRRLPVINGEQQLVGVVALADLGRSADGAAQDALKGISEPTDTERR